MEIEAGGEGHVSRAELAQPTPLGTGKRIEVDIVSVGAVLVMTGDDMMGDGASQKVSQICAESALFVEADGQLRQALCGRVQKRVRDRKRDPLPCVRAAARMRFAVPSVDRR